MKWLFLNSRQRLRRIFSNPRYAAAVAFREATWADERFLARMTGVGLFPIRRFLDEPARTLAFMRRLSDCEKLILISSQVAIFLRTTRCGMMRSWISPAA
jgi:hypothetical protein